MIVNARYIGPYREASIPGFANKSCKRGEEAKCRIPDGHELPGCWEPVEEAPAKKAGKKSSAKADDKPAKEGD